MQLVSWPKINFSGKTVRTVAVRNVIVRAEAGTTMSSGKEYMMSLPGISAPMGFFDPAGFTDSPTFTVGEAKRFREAELTHGRVSMLAVVGWLTAENFNPLFGGNITGPALGHFQEIEAIFPQFWEIILLAIGITEAYRISVGYSDPVEGGSQFKESYIPGDLQFDPLNLLPTDAEEAKNLKTKELNNGRLAMISILAYVVQEEVNKKTIVDTLNTFF